MKKIIYVLTSLVFSVFIIQPANANLEVVMGPLGPQVVTNFAPPANFGPTVGGHNGASPTVTGGSFAIVSPEGSVTNIVVCHSFCSNGTFGPGGDTAVLQIPNNNIGIWFGPGTTTYDKENKTFTAVDPVAREITNTSGDSSATIFGNKVLTFVSGNIFVDNGQLTGITESWSLDSTADVSVTDNEQSESFNLGTRKNIEEVQQIKNYSRLLLLNNKIQTLLSLLNGGTSDKSNIGVLGRAKTDKIKF
jgi:hypothetical protein